MKKVSHVPIDINDPLQALEFVGVNSMIFANKKGSLVTLLAGKVVQEESSDKVSFKYVKNIGKLAKELSWYKIIKKSISDQVGSHYVSVTPKILRKMGWGFNSKEIERDFQKKTFREG